MKKPIYHKHLFCKKSVLNFVVLHYSLQVTIRQSNFSQDLQATKIMFKHKIVSLKPKTFYLQVPSLQKFRILHKVIQLKENILIFSLGDFQAPVLFQTEEELNQHLS